MSSEAKTFFGWGTDGEHRPPPGSLRSPTSPQGGGKKNYELDNTDTGAPGLPSSIESSVTIIFAPGFRMACTSS